jgi:nicotinamidase-related amidase
VATKDFHPANHISFASNHPPPDNKPFDSFALIKNPHNPDETFNTRLWPDHCVQGTPGAELISELEVEKVDHIIKKGQDSRVEMYSAFTDPFENPSVTTSRLAEILHGKKITHAYVVGLAMDYCVKHTAVDAKKEGFEVYIIEEATKAVDDGPNGWGATEDFLSKTGIPLIKVDGREVSRVKSMH